MSKTHAVILAAGRGTRLQPVTGDLPKPMLSLNGAPLIQHVLDSLRAAGFQRFLMVVGYRHELFYGRFAADRDVHFALQDQPDGTGSATLLGREFTADHPFLLMFGDILADPEDLRSLWQRFLADPEAAALMAVKRVEDPYQGAAVYEDGGVVTRLVEKPPMGLSATCWNSAGIFAFRSAVYEELARLPLSPRGEYELTQAVVQLLEKGARVLAHPLLGAWRDVGRPEDVEAAVELTS